MKRYVVSKKKLLAYFFLIIILLFEYKFFFLISNTESILFKYNNGSATVLRTLICSIYVIICVNRFLKVFKQPCIKIVLIAYITIVFSGVISFCIYGNASMVSLRVISCTYLIIGSIFMFLILDAIKDVRRVLSILAVINCIACAVFIVQAYLFNTTGKLFLTIYWINKNIYLRSGSIRILDTMFLTLFSAVCSFAIIMDPKNRIKQIIHLLNIVISSIYLWYVAQTRMVQIIYLACILFLFLANYKGETIIRKFVKSLCIAIMVVGIIGGLWNEFFLTMSVSKAEISYFARYEAFLYYISIIPKNIITGITFLDFPNSYYFYYVHGPRGIYYTSDVGIVGTFAAYGFLTGIEYLLLCMKIISILRNTNDVFNLDLALVVMIICTLPTLSLFDYERFSLCVLIVSFSSYLSTMHNNEGISYVKKGSITNFM